MRRRDLAAAAAIAATVAALLFLPPLARLHLLSSDLLFAMDAALRPAPPLDAAGPVAVIAIDEETYRTPPFRDTPIALWAPELAKVLDRVLAAEPAVIGFDVIFPTSVERHLRGFERDLLVTLRRGAREGRIVLGMVQHQEQPIAPFAGQRLAVGAGNIRPTNVLNDTDEVIRRVPLILRGQDGEIPGLALELAARAAGQSVARNSDGEIWLGQWAVADRAGAMPVAFARPGVLPTYALADLAACAEKGDDAFFRQHFAGRVVLLGAVLDVEDRKVTAQRFATAPETPSTGARCVLPKPANLFRTDLRRETIPGVLIHANAVRNLLQKAPLREAAWAPPVANLGGAVLGAAAALLLGSGLGAAAVLLAAVAWTGVAWQAFAHLLVLPLTTPILAAVLALAAMLGWRFAVTDRDKRALRASFSLYLAPALVDRLAAGARAPELGGEERVVTAYFSDLAGFSTLTEKMAPGEVVALMNRYLSAMTDCIEAHGGMVDKYIGDAIVALFGAPLDEPDHAAQAVRAALACTAALDALNAELRPPTPLRQRIGLHTGPALVGNIGSRRRFNYTAMGDTMNLAARLESANKYFGTGILASDATRRAAAGAAEWREIDTVRVVGRREPVTLWEPSTAPPADARTYALGLTAWRRGHFSGAAAILGEAPNDSVSQALRQRALAMAASPPAPDWSGVTDLAGK